MQDQLETLTIIEAREWQLGPGWRQRKCWELVRVWVYFEPQLAGFEGRLNTWCERKKGVKGESKIFVWQWEGGTVLYLDGVDYRRSRLGMVAVKFRSSVLHVWSLRCLLNTEMEMSRIYLDMQTWSSRKGLRIVGRAQEDISPSSDAQCGWYHQRLYIRGMGSLHLCPGVAVWPIV